MEKLVLSISDVKLYSTCPQLFMYKYVDQLGPASGGSAALLVGTIVHKMLESKLLNSPDGRIYWAEFPGGGEGSDYAKADKETQEEAHKALLALQPALELWRPPDKWEIVDVEKELRKTVKLSDGSEVEVVGRLDCVVRAMGKLWHLQHKTIHASKPTDVFAEQMRTDWHETAYQVMATEHYGEAFAGTILNCVRKLSAKRIAENPSDVFVLHYLHRPEPIVNEGWEHIVSILDRMAWDIASYQCDVDVLKNRMACGGVYGNSLCKYKDVCDSRRTLDQMGFVPLERRYGESPADPE